MAKTREIHGITVNADFEHFEQKDHLKAEDKGGKCFGFTGSILKRLNAGQELLHNKDPQEFYNEAEEIEAIAADAIRDGEDEYEAVFRQMQLPHERVRAKVKSLQSELTKSKTAMITYKTKTGINHTLLFFKGSKGCVGFDANRGLYKGNFRRTASFLEEIVKRSNPDEIRIDRNSAFYSSL